MPSQIFHPVPRRSSPLLTSTLSASSLEAHNFFTASLSIKTQHPYCFVSRDQQQQQSLDDENYFSCPPAPPSSPVNFGRRSGDDANMTGSWSSDSGSESGKSSA